MQHPILWISDNNSALVRAQFEKSQTKTTTFLWKKSSPTHDSPFNFKSWSGKSDEFEKLVGENWLIVQKWLNFSSTKIFPDKVFARLALTCTSLELFQTKLHFPSSLSLVLQKSRTACKLDYISWHPAITASVILYNFFCIFHGTSILLKLFLQLNWNQSVLVNNRCLHFQEHFFVMSLLLRMLAFD